MQMKTETAHWHDRLAALASRHGVAGASLAIAIGDTTVAAATGVLNIRAGQPATTASPIAGCSQRKRAADGSG
jgi:hypothetical protein